METSLQVSLCGLQAHQYTLITYKLIFLLLLNTPTPTMFTPTAPQLILPLVIIIQDGEAQFRLSKQFSVFHNCASIIVAIYPKE